MNIRRYRPDDADNWDALVSRSWNGTFLHTRKFLSYHGNRFKDYSLVIEDEKSHLLGVFPAAVDPGLDERVVSHPGITYGGIAHDGSLRGSTMIQALQGITETYAKTGIKSLRYKATPYIYHRIPASDDLYALFRLGAIRYRCDLSATIDLSSRFPINRRRRRQLQKSREFGVVVNNDADYLEAFWEVLEENRWTRYHTKPIHTLQEMKSLQSMFPDNIICYAGFYNERVVSGALVFKTDNVAHVQYGAANEVGFKVSGQDAVYDYVINQTKAQDIRYFDFGTSNENEGTYLNDNLYHYKNEFGAGGVAHEFFELTLSQGG